MILTVEEKKQRERDRAKQRRKENREKLFNLLQTLECVECGIKDWQVLEFDHLDPSNKKDSVSNLVSGSAGSWSTVQKEIDKCQVLCANCHKKKTAIEQGWYKDFLDLKH